MLNLLVPTPLIKSGFSKRSKITSELWRNKKALSINKTKYPIFKQPIFTTILRFSRKEMLT